MAAIVVEDLRITYADLVAVDGLSFDAAPGEIVALLGPNGAGKTSTVEAIEGFRRPASGTIRVLGLDPIADHAALVPRIGVMLQDGGVATGIRPIEVLELYAAFFSDAEDPDELLTRVGLADRRRSTWRQLSGGEQQRLSLALALVGKPEVAFLDEPTAGVDPQGRQLIRQVITELRDAGVCVLVTTHDLDEAERLADRVLIIDRGRLVASGTPAELMAQTGTDEIRFGAPRGIDVAALGAALGASVREAAPGEYVATTAPTPDAVAALTAWLAANDLALGDLRAGRKRLEDVFLALTATPSEAAASRIAAAGGPGRSRRGARRAR
ncbi:MAG: ABC transporter ATP-binding protein [Acidimicrobiales bacterium]|nr:ABC transporter ATP-binding protein [Acidimicrobiales bacterium]MCB1259795.1 ABC transporter ATP-binding protein [Acidimicrobiales bacterium]